MTFFSNSQLGLSRSLRSNDLRWWNFESATSKFYNHSWNFGSSTQKGKVDLCMTNGSKVMVYLTLLNLLLHYLQEYSKIWNITKSNSSRPQWPQKAQLRIWKKCHGIIPFFPWMLKIASVFLCHFFGLALTVGDSVLGDMSKSLPHSPPLLELKAMC